MTRDNGGHENDRLDRDDAPELDEKWLEGAYHYHGDRLLKRGLGKDPFEAQEKGGKGQEG